MHVLCTRTRMKTHTYIMNFPSFCMSNGGKFLRYDSIYPSYVTDKQAVKSR